MQGHTNALLPTATLNARYGSQGLPEILRSHGTPVTTAGGPVVDGNGVPILVTDAAVTPVPIFVPVVTTTVVGTQKDGFGDRAEPDFPQ